MVTKFEDLDLSKSYTYGDYLTWQFGDMVELIKGKIFRMTPAPNLAHQRASSNLHVIIGSFLMKKPCQIFAAPFDVRLPLPPKKQSSDHINTVVQPDLSIICDDSKLDIHGCNGAPDWIIEILSPATSKKDLTDKYEIYQNAGVREYWLVYPTEQIIAPYVLNAEGVYQPIRTNPFVVGEKVRVSVFPGLELEVSAVWN